MLGLSVIILFKSLLHVFCSLVFSAHNTCVSAATRLTHKLMYQRDPEVCSEAQSVQGIQVEQLGSWCCDCVGKFFYHLQPLLLWAEKTREQNTCKSDLNRIMTERPNICYIFEKLSVQGCQIWHSHVSIPFNSAAAHSTRPHNAKKALYVIISGEIPEN